MLEALGIQLPDLMAGTLGGVCNVFILRRQGVFPIMGAIVVGASTGGYMGTWLGSVIHIAPTVTALVVGFAGGAVLKALAEIMMKRLDSGKENP